MWRRVSAVALVVMSFSMAAEKSKPGSQWNAHAGVAVRVFHPTQPRNWRGAGRKELRVTIWYPANVQAVETPQFIGAPETPLFEAGMAAPNVAFAPTLEKLPLLVMSHGTGGSAEQLAWLGTALARAGYVAAAVDHPGNNSTEAYTAEGFALWWERATDLSEVIDGMLKDEEFGPHLDNTRIAAVGFSLGGYSVMELAGARTDISVFYDQCREHADTAACHVPEMKSFGSPQQVLQATRKTSGESLARSSDSFRDPRVKAVFAIAPALGETLTQESLREVRLPLEIVVGAADRIVPAETNADYLRLNVRGARETVLPGGVGHYTFLDTCTAAGKKAAGTYCSDEAGVDRDKVHAQVAADAVKFFDRGLRGN